jgi:hypothetical protein
MYVGWLLVSYRYTALQDEALLGHESFTYESTQTVVSLLVLCIPAHA